MERIQADTETQATLARLYRDGLGRLLDDHGQDGPAPLPGQVVGEWAGHLFSVGSHQLCFFMAEPEHRIERLGLQQERAQVSSTIRRLVHPPETPSLLDLESRLAVQTCLLQERLCPLEPGPMARWLKQIHGALTCPAFAEPTAADLDRLLALLDTLSRHSVFTTQGWLGGAADALSLRHAVTDLMRSLPTILGRCSAITQAEQEQLRQRAGQIRL